CQGMKTPVIPEFCSRTPYGSLPLPRYSALDAPSRLGGRACLTWLAGTMRGQLRGGTVAGRSSRPGRKEDRERLRHDLVARGGSLKKIADEMARLWGFRPRQAWRHAN